MTGTGTGARARAHIRAAQSELLLSMQTGLSRTEKWSHEIEAGSELNLARAYLQSQRLHLLGRDRARADVLLQRVEETRQVLLKN